MKQSLVISLICLSVVPAVAALAPHKHHTARRPPVLDLDTAILVGDIPAVEAALQRGAAVDSQDDDGDTPLIHAALYREPSVVKVLLRHKASVNTEDFAGRTALDFVDPDLPTDPSASKQAQQTEQVKKAEIVALLSAAGAMKGSGNQAILSTDHRLIGRVTNYGTDTEDDQVHILEGTVTNRTGLNISYAEIDANFDDGDAVVDSGLANIQNLGPHESWHFKMTTLSKDAYGYKLTKLTSH